MELLVAVIALGAGVALVWFWMEHRHAAAKQDRARVAAVLAARRRHAASAERERAVDQRRRLAARNFQIAIQQLAQSPDFRRAASFAAAAHAVPLAFRQRQFRRLRPLLVNHFAGQLRKGLTAEVIAAGLAELVSALGVAPYEAEYIAAEAIGRTAERPAASPTRFEDQVEEWQAQHQQRLQTLRSLSLEPELKEQLLEQEEARFRDQLLAAGEPIAGGERINI